MLIPSRIARLSAAILGAAVLASCATPGDRLVRRASDSGFAHRIFASGGFAIDVFFKEGAKSREALHVYLEGDGSPWAGPGRINPDPTPRNPFMLDLMRLDPSPSLYLSRPCYNGHSQDPDCSALLWTHRRYGPEVVSSMANALETFLRERQFQSMVFLGHSGGGALALLVAPRFPATRAVVTIAGNADIDRWADFHGYSRLQGSLNPADYTNGDFLEIHYLGEKDEAVPPKLSQPALSMRPRAKMHVVKDFGHVCCWEKIWTEILAKIP